MTLFGDFVTVEIRNLLNSQGLSFVIDENQTILIISVIHVLLKCEHTLKRPALLSFFLKDDIFSHIFF